MKNAILILLLGALVVGCSGSASYEEGKQVADRTYGSMAPAEMMGQMDSVLQLVQSDLEKTDNKQDWWNGFCDRGEQIWLTRIGEINAAMGQQVLNPGQINSMFWQMRSSFRHSENRAPNKSVEGDAVIPAP